MKTNVIRHYSDSELLQIFSDFCIRSVGVLSDDFHFCITLDFDSYYGEAVNVVYNVIGRDGAGHELPIPEFRSPNRSVTMAYFNMFCDFVENLKNSNNMKS